MKKIDRKEIDGRINELEEVKKIQCSKGNFDQSEYMRGMANGLILAVAIMEDKSAKYIEAKKGKK